MSDNEFDELLHRLFEEIYKKYGRFPMRSKL